MSGILLELNPRLFQAITHSNTLGPKNLFLASANPLDDKRAKVTGHDWKMNALLPPFNLMKPWMRGHRKLRDHPPQKGGKLEMHKTIRQALGHMIMYAYDNTYACINIYLYTYIYIYTY